LPWVVLVRITSTIVEGHLTCVRYLHSLHSWISLATLRTYL
jgi:ABC-type microcin C transport system permease subunit YejE